jgi:hypothetical protein
MTDFFEWMLGKKTPDKTIEYGGAKKKGTFVVNNKPGDPTSADQKTYRRGEEKSVEEQSWAKHQEGMVKEKEALLGEVVAKRTSLESLMFDVKKNLPSATPQQLGALKQNIEILKLREVELQNGIKTLKLVPPTELDAFTSERKKHAMVQRDLGRAKTIIDKNVELLSGKKKDSVPPPAATPTSTPAMTERVIERKFYNAEGKQVDAPVTSAEDEFEAAVQSGKEPERKFYGPAGEPVSGNVNTGVALSAQSEVVERARESEGDINTLVTKSDNSQIIGNKKKTTIKSVPAIDAPRSDLDVGIFFSAYA